MIDNFNRQCFPHFKQILYVTYIKGMEKLIKKHIFGNIVHNYLIKQENNENNSCKKFMSKEIKTNSETTRFT